MKLIYHIELVKLTFINFGGVELVKGGDENNRDNIFYSCKVLYDFTEFSVYDSDDEEAKKSKEAYESFELATHSSLYVFIEPLSYQSHIRITFQHLNDVPNLLKNASNYIDLIEPLTLMNTQQSAT